MHAVAASRQEDSAPSLHPAEVVNPVSIGPSFVELGSLLLGTARVVARPPGVSFGNSAGACRARREDGRAGTAGWLLVLSWERALEGEPLSNRRSTILPF